LFILSFYLPVLSAQNNNSTNSEYSDSLEKSNNFLGVGAVIGAPSSIGLTAGIYAQTVSFRITGGVWNKYWYGIQGEVAIPLTRSTELIQNISLTGGIISTKVLQTDPNQPGVQFTQYNKQNYLGLAYDVYYAGFILQTGLGFGKGNFPNPQFLFQAGYLFRFNL
jgi:hypothetical protein